MYPNQNNNPYSIDYLNQISAPYQPPKQGMSPIKKALIIGGALLGVLFLTVTIIYLTTSGQVSSLAINSETVTQQLIKLNVTANLFGKEIGNSDLAALNSNIAVYSQDALNQLHSDKSSKENITKRISDAEKKASLDMSVASGVKISDREGESKEPTKKKNLVVDEKADTNSLYYKLENARLNATFDRSYVNEMYYELSTLYIQIQHIKETTKNKEQKDKFNSLLNNLNNIKKSVSELKNSVNI